MGLSLMAAVPHDQVKAMQLACFIIKGTYETADHDGRESRGPIAGDGTRYNNTAASECHKAVGAPGDPILLLARPSAMEINEELAVDFFPAEVQRHHIGLALSA